MNAVLKSALLKFVPLKSVQWKLTPTRLALEKFTFLSDRKPRSTPSRSQPLKSTPSPRALQSGLVAKTGVVEYNAAIKNRPNTTNISKIFFIYILVCDRIEKKIINHYYIILLNSSQKVNLLLNIVQRCKHNRLARAMRALVLVALHGDQSCMVHD